MANIGLDATSLSIYGKGISRFQYGMIKNFAKFNKQNHYYIFLNKKNIFPELPVYDNLQYLKFNILNRITWEQLQIPVIIKKYNLDIYFTAGDILPIAAQKKKFILFLFEIPDYRMQLFRRSGKNSFYARLSQNYNQFLFCSSLKKAKAIITSSYSTKNDLIQKYNISEKKIRVLYPSYDEQFCAAGNENDLLKIRKRYNAQAGYIFHISTKDPRDNTVSVIRAYKMAQAKSGIFQKLIIFGDVDYCETGLDRLIAELNLNNNVIFTGRLSNKDLIELYQAADLYIDPSLFEGFGFQVVEAMACGIPVIASNVTSLPEIVGEAGILVSPTDIDLLAESLIKVLKDSTFRQLMCRKSLERAKFFHWDKVFRETAYVCEEIFR